MSKVNRYFDKVFVINLYDNHERWAGMQKQLKRRKIKAERFVAVDGRCKHGEQACREKLATFEHAYGIKIKVPKGSPASKFLPAASSASAPFCSCAPWCATAGSACSYSRTTSTLCAASRPSLRRSSRTLETVRGTNCTSDAAASAAFAACRRSATGSTRTRAVGERRPEG